MFSTDALLGANQFAFEDHDQTNTLNAAYTWQLASDHTRFATLQSEYGSGFPVQFENGSGRLPAHWTLNASFGRKAPTQGHEYGWEVQATNVLNHHYLLKVNNGFNTTQYGAGRQKTVRLTAPLP